MANERGVRSKQQCSAGHLDHGIEDFRTLRSSSCDVIMKPPSQISMSGYLIKGLNYEHKIAKL